MMSETKFWDLIAHSRLLATASECENGDEYLDIQSSCLKDLLTKEPAEQILDFDRRFMELSQRAYRWDLWAAGYWLSGGCSDDGFIDFRATLISLGQDQFNRVLLDPDSLADIVGQPNIATLGLEGFQYAAGEAFEQVSGARPKDRTGYPPHLREPVGENFDFDDTNEMQRRFPKLTGKFPNGAY